MEKGFNSDIEINGNSFHIQTEDWGSTNPFLVSRVFQNGAVLKSVKTAYLEVLPSHQIKNPLAIRIAMEIQHKKILELLKCGKI
jgi:hypothetical protein